MKTKEQNIMGNYGEIIIYQTGHTRELPFYNFDRKTGDGHYSVD